jgi:hypothetical protein
VTRYTVHVPLVWNDGYDVPDAYIATVEDAIATRFGGFTRIEAMGAWGEQREPMALYFIDSDDVNAGRDLIEMAAAIAFGLDQEAVYVTKQPIEVTLVEQPA